MKTLGFLTIVVIVSSVCVNKLKLPLQDGHFVPKVVTRLAHNDYIMYLAPHKSLEVRSAQACIAKSILSCDSNLCIITEGEYKIAYGGLKKIFVKKGDKISQGQAIGSLGNIKDLPNKPVLGLYVSMQGKPIMDTSLFDRR